MKSSKRILLNTSILVLQSIMSYLDIFYNYVEYDTIRDFIISQWFLTIISIVVGIAFYFILLFSAKAISLALTGVANFKPQSFEELHRKLTFVISGIFVTYLLFLSYLKIFWF